MMRNTSPALNRVFEEELSYLTLTDQTEILGILYRMLDLKDIGAFDMAIDRIKDMHIQFRDAHKSSKTKKVLELLMEDRNVGNYNKP